MIVRAGATRRASTAASARRSAAASTPPSTPTGNTPTLTLRVCHTASEFIRTESWITASDTERRSGRSGTPAGNGWCYPVYNASAHASASGLKPDFIYHTHPWIVQEYFHQTASCGSAHRNASSVAAVAAGVKHIGCCRHSLGPGRR